ncbi:uncharacterized protein I206_105466 [Kwoniella pini CBS 10737]|uniref:sterol 3beta-glucosyltransferase n=1 Tax=Kwoniella pini CBS 10737 TaxID=1296096 RepID=A0AAJ8L8V4_9TREE
MPAVIKKLTNIFQSSPSSSPRLSATTNNTHVPPIVSKPNRKTTQTVDRTGMPCSCQLFDLFKIMAGGNTDSGLAGVEPDVEEDDNSSSGLSASSTAVEEAAHDDSNTEEDREGLQRWLDETLKDSEKERNSLSAKLTAMSLSNLTSLPKHHKARPALPHVVIEQSPELALDSDDNSQDIQPTTSAAIGVDNEVSEKDKLAAIIEEFGDVAGLLEGDEPERILADTKGALFKGVMMLGNFHLTTHRLLFHAIIPPEHESSSADSVDTRGPDVIHAGPVTIHRAGIQQARRVWMELTPEMVTTYPSATENDRVRPIRSILFSAVRQCEPFDPQQPCDFFVTHETPSGLRRTHFTVDTEQSASQWRRAFDGALYKNAKAKWRLEKGDLSDEWSYLRCCFPLDRTRIKGISPYHSFATLVGLDVSLEQTRQKDVCNISTGIVEGDITTEDEPVHKIRTPTSENLKRSLSSPRTPPVERSASPARMQFFNNVAAFSSDETKSNVVNHMDVNIGVFNEQVWFAKALESAVVAASQRKFKLNVQLPPVVFQISGHDLVTTDEDMDETIDSARSSMHSDEAIGGDEEKSSGGVLLLAARKAERASMAAKVFGLKEEEGVWIKRCYVASGFVPVRGHIIISPRYICFWRRNTVGADIKYRFRVEDLKGATSASGTKVGFVGMALHIHGHRDLKFDFWNKHSRDDKPAAPQYNPSPSPTPRSESPKPLNPNTESHPADILAPSKETMYQAKALPDEAVTFMPYLANKVQTNTVRLTPRTFACLTIGSRGDVQPYIALGLRLLKDGHKVIIVTHPEFKKWIEGYGIEHRQAGGDPTALMKLSQEHKMFSPGFFKESLGGFREWLDNLLIESWEACHDADVLIESPSTMAGIHIAEALKIPYFRAFTMPWTRTSAYPHAFMVPAFEMGPSFNYSTYVLFDNIMWKASAGQINRWRKKYLGLKSTDMTTLSVTKVPFLYNFSSAVVPKPLDWHDDIIITGYWNLEDSDTDWSPPPELDEFVMKAKQDGKPLGFGSIVVPRPDEMTKSIINAVEKADVRAIIAKGWSSRGGDPAKEGQDIQFPSNCFGVEKIPHSWLFPKVQAALHHGGAGTVGASLRAGVPTLIKPWFGDQFFWSVRVTKLGVGLKVPSLRSDDIANALIKATTDRVMIEKAARIGEKIRSESGVDKALEAINNNVLRAGSDRRNLKWAS